MQSRLEELDDLAGSGEGFDEFEEDFAEKHPFIKQT